MKSNSYIGLLDSDTIIIRHPKTHKEVKLHRTIAMKTFQLTPPRIQGITDVATAEKYKKFMQKQLDSIENTYKGYDSLIASAIEKEDLEKVKKLTTDKIKCESDLKRFLSEVTKHDALLNSPESLQSPKTIEIYTIGGYVESLDNLDPENPVWVDHRVRVFDNAKILDNSLITENCIIYDNAQVINSRVQNYARIHDNCRIEDSIIRDLTEVKNQAVLKNCLLENASMVFESANIENCILNTGALCRGKSSVRNSIILDTSQIQGESIVDNCLLQYSSCLLSGTHSDAHFLDTVSLETRVSEGEIPRQW